MPSILIALKNPRGASFLWLRIWPFILQLTAAVWWGGLTFYTAIVVPIGTRVLGSIEQGFLTRHVTQMYNTLTVVFVLLVLAESIRRRHRGLAICGMLLMWIDLVLIQWHRRLSAMMVDETHSVADGFYRVHATYLWLTTAEWLIGIVTLIILNFQAAILTDHSEPDPAGHCRTPYPESHPTPP